MSKQVDGTYVDGTELPGFHSLLGYRQASWEENEAVIALELQSRHLNLGGVIHGGCLRRCLILLWLRVAHTAPTRGGCVKPSPCL